MNIYRNKRTKRLVTLSYVSFKSFDLRETDYFTGKELSSAASPDNLGKLYEMVAVSPRAIAYLRV